MASECNKSSIRKRFVASLETGHCKDGIGTLPRFISHVGAEVTVFARCPADQAASASSVPSSAPIASSCLLVPLFP